MIKVLLLNDSFLNTPFKNNSLKTNVSDYFRNRVSWSTSVSVTELRVPSMAVLGESVTLVCSYDLGNEELYVVKWYKDELEFYRFEPKDHNQSVYFPQPGINIDIYFFIRKESLLTKFVSDYVRNRDFAKAPLYRGSTMIFEMYNFEVGLSMFFDNRGEKF
ncbi:UNVERIFIED_CONTAM: hypothetical protein NCL1_29971 [Trichonephila clavipes]